MIDLEVFSETQKAIALRIALLPAAEQPRELLKWALARLTHYGPSHEPAAQVIRAFLDDGKLNPDEFRC